MSTQTPTTQPSVTDHLQHSLVSYSQAVKAEDFSRSEACISELVEFIDSLSDAAISDPDDDVHLDNAISVLDHTLSFLSNPSLDQAIIDGLSFELPKAVAKFAGVSKRCSEIVKSIIDLFTAKCSPRDLISVFSEALDSYGKTTDAPGYVACLLHGVSQVFLSIQRRHFEQIKVAVPIILNTLKAASFDLDSGDVGLKDLYEGAIDIANSVLATSKKLEDGENERLRSLLGLYVLQVMVLVSSSMADEVTNCLYLVQKLSSFFTYCGLSYAELITCKGVDPLVKVVHGDAVDDDYMNCFSYVKFGAVLSVIWGNISIEVTQAAEQDLDSFKGELRNNQGERWSAIGMLKHIFTLSMLPWTLKEHAIDFLLDITDGIKQQEMYENKICSFQTPNLISTLQAIVLLIMSAPNAEPRKKALLALKRVLADNPPALRIDILQHLVRTSSSPSMIAILLDSVVRENLHNDYSKLQEKKLSPDNSIWNASVLDLLELVLRPPTGGPPSLPEQTDAVLSALNLFRYVLMAESKGKTNYTGLLAKTTLQKAYNEWLLPLRTLVTGIIQENKNDYDQVAFDITCGLNPVELVLYRCIELVEEKLKQLL